MDQLTSDKLELAIQRYVEGLDRDDLELLVSDEIWDWYQTKASPEDIKEFIEGMQITDEEVAA